MRVEEEHVQHGRRRCAPSVRDLLLRQQRGRLLSTRQTHMKARAGHRSPKKPQSNARPLCSQRGARAERGVFFPRRDTNKKGRSKGASSALRARSSASCSSSVGLTFQKRRRVQEDKNTRTPDKTPRRVCRALSSGRARIRRRGPLRARAHTHANRARTRTRGAGGSLGGLGGVGGVGARRSWVPGLRQRPRSATQSRACLSRRASRRHTSTRARARARARLAIRTTRL